LPVFVNSKPTYFGRPQLVPSPTFVPIPVPSQPAPINPTVVSNVHPGINTPHLTPQPSTPLPLPTTPTYIHHQHGTSPQQGVFMQQLPVNFPVYGPPPTSTTNVLPGQGQMSSQLFAHQLALYQHQQQLQQHQQLIQEQHSNDKYY
jgi:hypothetical protein